MRPLLCRTKRTARTERGLLREHSTGKVPRAPGVHVERRGNHKAHDSDFRFDTCAVSETNIWYLVVHTYTRVYVFFFLLKLSHKVP